MKVCVHVELFVFSTNGRYCVNRISFWKEYFVILYHVMVYEDVDQHSVHNTHSVDLVTLLHDLAIFWLSKLRCFCILNNWYIKMWIMYHTCINPLQHNAHFISELKKKRSDVTPERVVVYSWSPYWTVWNSLPCETS